MRCIRRRIARHRIARGAGLAGVAAAATAAAIVLTSRVPGSPEHSPAAGRALPGAAADLRTLAMVAAAQPAIRLPGPGQYWYFATEGLDPSCLRPTARSSGYGYFSNCAIRVRYIQRTQTWIGANGSGRVLTTTVRATFPARRDRARWIAAGRPPLHTAPENLIFGPHQLYLGPRDLRTLPTDPARLAALLYRRRIEGGPPGRAEDFTQIGDLLRYTDAPPALRSAAFHVGERIPGVKVLGTVSFRGITGLGIAYLSYPPKRYLPRYAGDYHESELIFDPRTSALRAEVQADVSARSRTVVTDGWVIYLSSGLVRSTTSTRAGQ